MNRSMIFTIEAIDNNGAVVDTIIARNKITATGIKHLAKGSDKLADGKEVEYKLNTVFIGDDNTAVKYNDDGLKNKLLVIKADDDVNYFSRSSLYLPLGTYKEIAIGFNHPELGDCVFNRAILSKELVVTEDFYTKGTGFNITYELEGLSDTSLSRSTILMLGDEKFNVSTTIFMNTNNNNMPWNTATGSVIANSGPDVRGATSKWETSLTRNNQDDNVIILETKVRNIDTVPKYLTSTGIRIAGQVISSIYLDDDGKGILMQPNEQISLQTEVHILPGINIPTRVSPLETGFKPNNYNYNLNYNYVSYNPKVTRSGYFVNKETGERVDVDLSKISTGPGYVGLSDNDRETNFSYQETYHAFFIQNLSKTGIWDFYIDNFSVPQLSSIVVGNTNPASGLPTLPSPTYNIVTTDSSGRNTLIFTNHNSAVDEVVVYNRFTDKLTVYPFNDNDVLLSESDSPLIRTGALAIKFKSLSDPTRQGIWRVASDTNTGILNPPAAVSYINVNDTLVHDDFVYPPINLIYNRALKTVTGILLNGNKLRIRDSVTDNILMDFDVVTNEDFNIDLSLLNMFVTEKYKFSSVNENGLESDSYTFSGFKSVELSAPENIVYNESALTLTFDVNSPTATRVVLRRWNYEFYILDTVTLGSNVIALTEPLDPNGQYELICKDIMGTASEPSYVFGEKPEDLPTQVTDNTQPAVTVTQATGSVNTANVVGFYVDPNSENKWWEKVTWFASVKGITKEITFDGIKSHFPVGHAQYNPMLTFTIKDGEYTLYFGPIDEGQANSVSNQHYGYWRFIGGPTNVSNLYDITLWTSWIPFDGELLSNVYDGVRQDNKRVTGINRYTHQIIENKTGYIRRALGLNLTSNASLYLNACPIDFDVTYLNTGGNLTLPSPVAMTANARMYFTASAQTFFGTAIAPGDVSKYSVLINDKEAVPTVTGTVTVSGYEGVSKISWQNEDGVIYLQDLATGIWSRSDSEDHTDDPEYDMVVDTIRICTTAGYNQLRHPIQPNVDINSNMVFEDNIRNINFGTAWMAVKAWVRPYRSGNKIMNINHDSTGVTYIKKDTQFNLNFDMSLLDAGNELEFYLNGEPAELIAPVAPAKVPASPANYYLGNPTDVLRLGGPSLYNKNYPVSNTMTETDLVKVGYNIYSRSESGNWAIDGRGEIYEEYRLSLPNPDDYLTYQQLLTMSYSGSSSSIGLCVEDLPEDLRVKKLLVPIKWQRSEISELITAYETTPDALAISYSGYTFTESYASYFSRLQNSKLYDVENAIKCGFRSIVIGHMEYDLSSTESVEFTNVELTSVSSTSSTGYVVTIYPTQVAMLGLSYTKDTTVYDYVMHPWNGYSTEKSMYTYVIPNDQEISKYLSKTIFGEEREYYTSDTLNAELITTKIFNNGVFNVAAARAKGLTGKFLIAIILNSAIVTEQRRSSYSLFADYSAETAYNDLVNRLSNYPRLEDGYVVGHMEIDLSKTDEELNALPDVNDYIIYSSNTGAYISYTAPYVHCFARLTTTVDGWVKEFTIDKYKQIDISKGQMFALSSSPVYEYTVAEQSSIPRTIRSENYEVQEILGSRNLWVFTKDLVDRRADKYGHKEHRLFIKTKRFNSVNVFTGDGNTSVTVDDSIGNVYALERARLRSTTPLTKLHYVDLDPRSHYCNFVSTSYVNNNQYGLSLFNYFNVIETTLGNSIENILVGSYRGELIRIRKLSYIESDLKLNSDGTNPRIYEFVKEDGTVVGYIDNSMDGNSRKSLVIVNTDPGLHDFVFIVPNYNDDLMWRLNNSHYYHLKLANDYAAIGFAYIIFDINNPPEVELLNLVTPTNLNIGPYNSSIDYLEFEKPYMSGAAPGWDYVNTLETLNTNYKVYINSKLCTSTSENIASMDVVVMVDGVETIKTVTDVVKYTFTSPLGTIASYYYKVGVGCFKREITNTNPEDNKYIIIFESKKAFYHKVGDTRYKPIYTTIDLNDVVTDVSGTRIYTGYNNNSSYVSYENNNAYATNKYEGMFVRPSFVNMVSNPSFIDYTELRKDTALRVINESISSKLTEFENNYLDELMSETFNVDKFIQLLPFPVNNDVAINNNSSTDMLSIHTATNNNLGGAETNAYRTGLTIYGMLTNSIQFVSEGAITLAGGGEDLTADGRLKEVTMLGGEFYSQGNAFSGSGHKFIQITLTNVSSRIINYNGDVSNVIPGITNEYSDPLSGYYKVDESVKMGTYEYAINYTSKYDSLLAFANANFPTGVKAIADQYTIEETGEVIEIVHLFILNPGYYNEGMSMLEVLNTRTRPTVRTPYIWFQPYSYGTIDVILERSGNKPAAAVMYVNHDIEGDSVGRQIQIQYPTVNWNTPSISITDMLYQSGPTLESTFDDSYGKAMSEDGFIVSKVSGWSPVASNDVFIYDKNTALMVNYDDVMPAINADPNQSLYIYRELSEDGTMVRYVIREYIFNDNTREPLDINTLTVEQYFDSVMEDKYSADIRLIENSPATATANMSTIPVPSLAVGLFRKDVTETAGLDIAAYYNSINVDMFNELIDYRVNGKPVTFETYVYDSSARTATLVFSNEDIRITAAYRSLSFYANGGINERLSFYASATYELLNPDLNDMAISVTTKEWLYPSAIYSPDKEYPNTAWVFREYYPSYRYMQHRNAGVVLYTEDSNSKVRVAQLVSYHSVNNSTITTSLATADAISVNGIFTY